MPKKPTAEVHSLLQAKFGDKILELVEPGPAKDSSIFVAPAAIAEVCAFLKTEPGLEYDCLSNLSGVDYPKKQAIEIVYHLYSYVHFHTLCLKIDMPRDDPSVPTLERVWATANWHEREVYDLLGVFFEGHSDLRRILMPEDWVGHPLRKDFVEPEEYHGIPTRRESMLR